ncbi:MAG TPA: response regulator transcription factor, partial [Thermoanaerobaculia bacterium]|nr:response regulator transcription factor [Thermoanaerobaculia bacterium]
MATKAESSTEGDSKPRRGGPGRARLLLVDDRPVARLGLAEILTEEGSFTVAGESDGGPEVLDRVSELRPAVVVLDISIRHGDGVELIKRLLSRFPDLRILVFSMRDERYFAHRCLEAGAKGYVSKKAKPDEVIA